MPSSRFSSLMQQLSELPHGDLKLIAVKIKAKVSHTPHPSEADYCDAIHEAATELVRECGDAGA